MKEHIFLANAHVYPLPRNKPNMDDCHFNAEGGFWVINNTESPMVRDRERPKPTTKKFDVETGEDRK